MTTVKSTFGFVLGVLFVVIAGLIFITPTEHVSAVSADDWKAGRIIDDYVFTNSKSMTTSQIQAFLDAKLPNCDTNGSKSISYNYNSSTGRVNHDSDPVVTTTRAKYGERYENWRDKQGLYSKGAEAPYVCLKDYAQNIPSKSANEYCSGSISSGTKSSATIIKEVSTACNINPQVLLVLLQKEQSLITDDWPWGRQYEAATGYACPDTAPCDPDYAGFFKQIYYSAWQYQKYIHSPLDYNYAVGDRYIQYDVETSCGGSNVKIKTAATAALYNYTPYQPNSASLKAYPGSAEPCGSYGNRNFWFRFNEWFGSTTGSALFQINGTGTYYLEWGDYYYPIHNEDILYAYGLQRFAPRDVSDLPNNKEKGPALRRAAKFGSENPDDPDYTALVEVIDGGKRHGVPNSATLARHGFSDYTNFPSELSAILSTGDALRPVVRKPNGAIYLMEDNKKRGFPDGETYSNLSGPNYKGNEQIYSKQSLTNLSSRYINAKQNGAPMLLSGKFISSKDTSAIYLYDDGVAKLFSVGSYASWGGKLDYNFSMSSLNQVPKSGSVPVLVTASDGKNYLIDQGQKKVLSDSVAQEWGLGVEDFTAITGRSLSRLQGGDDAGTLIQRKGRPGIYLVEGGKRHGIPSLWDFSNLGLSWSDVQTIHSYTAKLTSRGADKYAPGSLMRKPNGAVYLIDTNYTAYGVTSGSLFTRFGFNWKNVRNVNNNFFDPYDISSNLITLVDTPDGKKYIVENGLKRQLSSDAFGTEQYAFNDDPIITLSDKTLSIIDTGESLTRYIRGDGPTVYYIEDGKRRPFTTEQSFYDKGGSWNKVIDVSEEFLNEIPRGAKL